jgi:hypothetical protein
MTGFKTPPIGDFHSYSALVAQQGGHLGTIHGYAAGQCAQDGDLDGLLYPVRPLVHDVSQFFQSKLAQCQRGMTLVSGKVDRTAADYSAADAASAADLRKLYPAAYSAMPDLGSIPGAHLVGNYRDEGVSPQEPTSAAADEATNIKHQLRALMLNFQGGELAGAEKLFKWCTGQSLIELLLKPLLGDYGRLLYLHDAYTELSKGVYTVAGTLRKGSWALGSEWQGDAARAFDSYMFCWSMGIGGVGDAATLTGKVFKDAYDVVVALVHVALSEINALMNEFVELAKQAAETAAADAAIEVAGGGPEDPIADVAAGLVTAWKLYKIYKIVRRIISGVNAVETIYGKISAAVQAVPQEINKIIAAINAPLPSIGSLVDDVEQRGFSFEQNAGWSPTLGAARMTMLPAA